MAVPKKRKYSPLKGFPQVNNNRNIYASSNNFATNRNTKIYNLSSIQEQNKNTPNTNWVSKFASTLVYVNKYHKLTHLSNSASKSALFTNNTTFRQKNLTTTTKLDIRRPARLNLDISWIGTFGKQVKHINNTKWHKFDTTVEHLNNDITVPSLKLKTEFAHTSALSPFKKRQIMAFVISRTIIQKLLHRVNINAKLESLFMSNLFSLFRPNLLNYITGKYTLMYACDTLNAITLNKSLAYAELNYTKLFLQALNRQFLYLLNQRTINDLTSSTLFKFYNSLRQDGTVKNKFDLTSNSDFKYLTHLYQKIHETPHNNLIILNKKLNLLPLGKTKKNALNFLFLSRRVLISTISSAFSIYEVPLIVYNTTCHKALNPFYKAPKPLINKPNTTFSKKIKQKAKLINYTNTKRIYAKSQILTRLVPLRTTSPVNKYIKARNNNNKLAQIQFKKTKNLTLISGNYSSNITNLWLSVAIKAQKLDAPKNLITLKTYQSQIKTIPVLRQRNIFNIYNKQINNENLKVKLLQHKKLNKIKKI